MRLYLSHSGEIPVLVQKTRGKNSEEEKEDEEEKSQDFVHPDNLQKNYCTKHYLLVAVMSRVYRKIGKKQ